MSKDQLDKTEQLKRSFVAHIRDRKRLQRDESIAAQREVVSQLDAIEPDIEKLRESLNLFLAAKGADSIFDRDPYTALSIKDALEANKNREAAKAAVKLVADEVAEEMRSENRLYKKRVARERDQLRALLGDTSAKR